MAESKIYPVTYNKEHYTVLANDVLKGKQEMSLQEARIIRFLITQVVKEDKDLKTYVMRISEFADFVGIDSSNLYKDIMKFCDVLLDKKVRIGTGNPKRPWKMFHFISMASYDGNGSLTLKLSDEIKPFVVELDKYFTQYQFKNVLAMNSYYGIRLYELLKMTDGLNQYKNEFEFSVVELREYFCCEKKYKTTGEFKRKVIDVAISEINAKTDLRVTPTYKKTGRAITHIIFEVHYQSRKQIGGQISLNGVNAGE